MPDATDAVPANDPIYARLEDQINWYDRKSRSAQRAFKRIKVVEIFAAAIIPFLSGISIPDDKLIIAGLGVLITILEGFLHLNSYQQLWGTYRSTCEALRHEKYVYIAKAGPYAVAADPRAMLAERVESLVSQEHAQWSSFQQQGGKVADKQQP
ncbi:MAG TPA: DUF4231 domain-containing protein [Terracidiphilus sp.]|nr:DUF4231 domain-containing protein [Terracidiphilus sp.]